MLDWFSIIVSIIFKLKKQNLATNIYILDGWNIV